MRRGVFTFWLLLLVAGVLPGGVIELVETGAPVEDALMRTTADGTPEILLRRDEAVWERLAVDGAALAENRGTVRIDPTAWYVSTLAELDGEPGDEWVWLGREGVGLVNFATGTVELSLPMASIFAPFPQGLQNESPYWEFAYDLDDDGRDELLVPTLEGRTLVSFAPTPRVITKLEGGAWQSFSLRFDEFSVRHRLFPVFTPVVEGAQRIVLPNRYALDHYTPGETKPWEHQERSLPFVNDPGRNGEEERDDDGRLIAELMAADDFNADESLDLAAVQFTTGGGLVFDATARLLVWFGDADGGWAREPDQILGGDELVVDWKTGGDWARGTGFIAAAKVQTGLWNLVGMLFSREAEIRLTHYALDGDGFADEPTAAIEIGLKFDFRAGARNQPVWAYGDFDRRGNVDLLTSRKPGHLTLYRSAGVAQWERRSSDEARVLLPSSGGRLRLWPREGPVDYVYWTYGENDADGERTSTLALGWWGRAYAAPAER